MQYESIDPSISDLDIYVIIKLDKYYRGNIFLDEMIGVCKFDGYLLEKDCSNRAKIDVLSLIEIFEIDFGEIYDQIIEIYEESDYLVIAQECLGSIMNKSVLRYCKNTYRKLENVQDVSERIELLNQLLTDSILDPEDIPAIEKNIIYQTRRSLFEVGSKRSKNAKKNYRFTIAKRVLQYLESEEDFTVSLQFLNQYRHVLFQVSEAYFETEPMFSDSRKVFSNGGDGSKRANGPKSIMDKMGSSDKELDLIIRLVNDEIFFSLYES